MVDEDISIGAIGLEALASTDPMPPPLDRQQLYEFFKVSEADNSIRVLDIDALPRPSTGDIELSARLRVVSLDSNPQFAALSYVWGDYSAPVKDILTIHLDDGRSAQVQITANCKDAIQAIGNKFGPLTIWIDAICINQEDEDEKASQILHLEDIYTWAEMVYVWLGPDTEASRKLFRWLSSASAYLHFTDVVALGKASTPTERLSQRRKLLLNIVVNFFRRLWTRQLGSIDFWLTILTFWRGDFFKGIIGVMDGLYWTTFFTKQATLPHWKSGALLSPHDVEDVFNRQWFRRGWTFQEMVLASDMTILCGSTAIKWDVFVRGLIHLFDRSKLQETHREILKLAAIDKVKDLLTVWIHFPRPMTKRREARSKTLSRDSSVNFYLSCGQTDLLSWHWFYNLLFLHLVFLLISWIHVFANIFLFELLIGLGLSLVTHYEMYDLLRAGAVISRAATTYLFCFSEIIHANLLYNSLVETKADGSMRPWYHLGYYRWTLQLNHGANSIQGEASDSRTLPRDSLVNGMVWALRERQTKDPKDRSFSAAAVLSRLGIELERPDYFKELGEVYRAHFESLLRWDAGLLNLIIDANGLHVPGTPSWVPMWNEVKKRNWIGAPYSYEHAAESTPHQIVILGHDFLIVRGQLLGIAKFCSGPFPLIGDDLLVLSWDQWPISQQNAILRAAFQFANWIHYVKNHIATILEYETSIPELVSRVLALRYRDDEPEEFIRRPTRVEGLETCPLKGEIFDSWYRRMSTIEPAILETIKRERSEELRGRFEPHVFSTQERNSASNVTVREQTVKLSNVLSGKRNVLVSDMGYLGSGPELMQENDEIYWITGVSVPMVLRRSTHDSTFTVIGPAFVYGFMSRECVKDREFVSLQLV